MAISSGSISRNKTTGPKIGIYLRLSSHVGKCESTDTAQPAIHENKCPFPRHAHSALGTVIFLHLCQI